MIIIPRWLFCACRARRGEHAPPPPPSYYRNCTMCISSSSSSSSTNRGRGGVRRKPVRRRYAHESDHHVDQLQTYVCDKELENLSCSAAPATPRAHDKRTVDSRTRSKCRAVSPRVFKPLLFVAKGQGRVATAYTTVVVFAFVSFGFVLFSRRVRVLHITHTHVTRLNAVRDNYCSDDTDSLALSVRLFVLMRLLRSSSSVGKRFITVFYL